LSSGKYGLNSLRGDIIDTLGKRLLEIVVPIPRSAKRRDSLASLTREVVEERAQLRDRAKELALAIEGAEQLDEEERRIGRGDGALAQPIQFAWKASLDISRTMRVGPLTCSDGAESLHHLVMLRLREQLHLRSSMPAASHADRAGILVWVADLVADRALYVPPTWSRV
jgi:hypothetical protein